MHEKHPFLTAKATQVSTPTRARASKGDDGFTREICDARGRRRGLAAVPVGGGGAWPDNQPTRRATHQRPSATGVEGAGGTCRGAGGRRRGLAGLRDDAPSEARGAVGSRAGRRPPAHTAAGPDGAQNTSSTTSNNMQCQRRAGGQATRRPEIWRGTKRRRKTRGAASTAGRRSLRTPRSTPGSGRPGGRRGGRVH